MILSEIKNVYKIYLITERSFVVDFFKKVLRVSNNIIVESFLPSEEKSSDVLVVIDSIILETSAAAFAKGLEDKEYPILCLADVDLSDNISGFVERMFRYVIPFPVQEELFSRYFYDSLNKIQSDCPDSRFLISGYRNLRFYGVENASSSADNVNQPEINKGAASKYTVEKENNSDNSLFGCFVGISNEIATVRKKLRKLAAVDVPVLFLGETGTGKSTGASIIHKLSKRNKRDMKSLNISTISESVACSTFFGTTLGAFTDAIDKKGFFTLADKGILFLDEIGTASNAIQSMLLTVIDSGIFQKVGSESFEKSDVRLLFATNSDLGEMIKEGSFRKDFYCRICGNAIMFPTLRSRKCDIPYIINEHLKEKNKIISDSAFDKLMEYDWPGNIRELHQCIDRGVLYSSGDIIGPDDIEFGLFCI